MFTHHQSLLFLSYIEEYTDEALINWEKRRKIKNLSLPERQYITNQIKEAPEPKEPQKLLFTFLQESGNRISRTLGAWLDKQEFKDENRKARLANLATHLEHLDIPTI